MRKTWNLLLVRLGQATLVKQFIEAAPLIQGRTWESICFVTVLIPGTSEQACSCLITWLSSPWRLAPLEFLRASSIFSTSTVPSPSASNCAKAWGGTKKEHLFQHIYFKQKFKVFHRNRSSKHYNTIKQKNQNNLFLRSIEFMTNESRNQGCLGRSLCFHIWVCSLIIKLDISSELLP